MGKTRQEFDSSVSSKQTHILWWILSEHGPWALGCTVLCVALYLFALKPMSDERKILLGALTSSVADSKTLMSRVAASTEEIAASTARQFKSVERLNILLDHNALIHEETKQLINKFANEVRDTHPLQIRKLDEIIDQVSKDK